MIVKEGNHKRLDWSYYAVLIETEGVVSTQWVGTSEFVNYAWIPQMPASDNKWQYLLLSYFLVWRNHSFAWHGSPTKGASVVSPLQFKNL
jgi:hypothetical protein